MSNTPYLGEIMMISWNYPPRGWAFCNGQFLPINQNQALFSLLGTTYGGNGQTTFALPDLRGRIPMHIGNFHSQGERGGQEAHTVTMSEMPAHTHVVTASSANGATVLPASSYLGQITGGYTGPTSLTTLHPSSVTNAGGSQPHENRQPFLVINFVIAIDQAIFPSRN